MYISGPGIPHSSAKLLLPLLYPGNLSVVKGSVFSKTISLKIRNSNLFFGQEDV